MEEVSSRPGSLRASDAPPPVKWGPSGRLTCLQSSALAGAPRRTLIWMHNSHSVGTGFRLPSGSGQRWHCQASRAVDLHFWAPVSPSALGCVAQSLSCHCLTEPSRVCWQAMALSSREATRATPGRARVWGGAGVGTGYQRWNLASPKGLEAHSGTVCPAPLLPISAPKSRKTAPLCCRLTLHPGARGSGQ